MKNLENGAGLADEADKFEEGPLDPAPVVTSYRLGQRRWADTSAEALLARRERSRHNEGRGEEPPPMPEAANDGIGWGRSSFRIDVTIDLNLDIFSRLDWLTYELGMVKEATGLKRGNKPLDAMINEILGQYLLNRGQW
jgi:hypothetical protein